MLRLHRLHSLYVTRSYFRVFSSFSCQYDCFLRLLWQRWMLRIAGLWVCEDYSYCVSVFGWFLFSCPHKIPRTLRLLWLSDLWHNSFNQQCQLAPTAGGANRLNCESYMMLCSWKMEIKSPVNIFKKYNLIKLARSLQSLWVKHAGPWQITCPGIRQVKCFIIYCLIVGEKHEEIMLALQICSPLCVNVHHVMLI